MPQIKLATRLRIKDWRRLKPLAEPSVCDVILTLEAIPLIRRTAVAVLSRFAKFSRGGQQRRHAIILRLNLICRILRPFRFDFPY